MYIVWFQKYIFGKDRISCFFKSSPLKIVTSPSTSHLVMPVEVSLLAPGVEIFTYCDSLYMRLLGLCGDSCGHPY